MYPQVSETCANETNTIEDELRDEFVQVSFSTDCERNGKRCDVYVSSNYVEASRSVCAEVNGQLQIETLTISCQSGRDDYIFDFNDLPNCVGQSCTAADLMEFERVSETYYGDIFEAESGGALDCERVSQHNQEKEREKNHGGYHSVFS